MVPAWDTAFVIFKRYPIKDVPTFKDHAAGLKEGLSRYIEVGTCTPVLKNTEVATLFQCVDRAASYPVASIVKTVRMAADAVENAEQCAVVFVADIDDLFIFASHDT